MYEVIGLKDFGTWLRKGVKCYCNDDLTFKLLRKGYLKVLKYHLTKSGKWNIEQSYSNLKERHKALNMKIKGYEAYFDTIEKGETKKDESFEETYKKFKMN